MINLNTPSGAKPLNYPHWTKHVNGKLIVVTKSDGLISAGDIICDHSVDERGNIISVNLKAMRVDDILEQRKARGEHKIDAVFQLLKVSPIN